MTETSNVLTFKAKVNLMAAAVGEPRPFKVEAYSGGPLRLNGFTLPVVVDLAGLSSDPNIVANLDHDPNKRVGHVTGILNNLRTLQLAGVVSAESAAAQEFVGSAKKQFPWSASIEARPEGQMEHVPAGQSVSVNGRTFNGPLLVARKSTLYGIAILSKGADPKARAMLAQKGTKMTFEDWVKSLEQDPLNLSDDQKAKLQAAYSALHPGDTMTASYVDANEIRAKHPDYVSELDCIFSSYISTNPEKAGEFKDMKAVAEKNLNDIKAQALRESWPASQYHEAITHTTHNAERDLIRAERPKGPGIRVSNYDSSGTVIEAAFAQSIGLPNIEKHYSDQELQAAHTQFRGRLGLQQMLIMAASANGYRYQPGEKVHNGNLHDILAYALPARGPQNIQASGVTTLSLPGIFSNVANKNLLEGYLEEDQSWREIAAVKPVSDFKQATSYRLLDNLEYEELAPDGRIKHGTVGEESYTRQIKTYAKMGALTRVDIINDDLGAFDDLRMRLGRGAAKKFNRLFWTRFLDNASFFTSGRGNYVTGSTTNLATDGVGLEFGVLAFRKLRTSTADGSKKVGGRPEILLCPPELEFNARRLYQSTNVVSGSTTQDTVPNTNIYAGLYRPVIVDQLSDEDYSGSSDKAWYLFRATNNLASVVVSFLNGQQNPTVEQADADFDQLGIQFRGFHDFGIDFAEYLAGVKVKGEA